MDFSDVEFQFRIDLEGEFHIDWDEDFFTKEENEMIKDHVMLIKTLMRWSKNTSPIIN